MWSIYLQFCKSSKQIVANDKCLNFLLGLRVQNMEEAAKLTLSGFILHNLSIQHGYNGEDLDNIEDEQAGHFFAEESGDQPVDQDPPRGTRRNQLLPFFQR